MIHYTFIRRQLTTARQQSVIFILCVALAIVTIVGLNSFGASVNQTLNSDARELMAGDAVVDSSYALSQPVQEVIAQLADSGQAQATTIITLYTVAQVLTQDNSLLTELNTPTTSASAAPSWPAGVLASNTTRSPTSTPSCSARPCPSTSC